MPPIAKDAENLAPKPDGSARATSGSGDSAIKQQPVALEVPVTVNGARALDGSDKREPFSESTKTVLIFGSGAVIRLSSAVAPGQLLFLTNEKTKKEVVCQVVKSKNYRSVSGYVELEFTESVVGFWGMRFPGDRISPAPQHARPALAANATPSAVPAKPAAPVSAVKEAVLKPAETKSVAPAAPKLEDVLPQKPVAPVAPLASTLSSSFDPEAPLSVRTTAPAAPVVPVVPAVPVSPAPQAPVNSVPAQLITPASALIDSPRASEVQASFLEPAKTPVAPVVPTVPNLLALFEGEPATPEVDAPPAVQICVDTETETLKKHTARLQEELSHIMFSREPETQETVSVQIPHASPVVIQKELADSGAKAVEQSKIHAPELPPPARVEPVQFETASTKSLLEHEELKIPAWLEPLARNAAPSSPQGLVDKEKTKSLVEQPHVEETTAEAAAPAAENHIFELLPPTFGSALPLDEVRGMRESRSGNSGKGLLMGAIATGVLVLAGGGWWYMQRQSGGVQAGSEPASNVQASVAALPVASSPSQTQQSAPPQVNPPAQSNPPALTNASAQAKSSSNTLSVVPAVQSAPPARNSQPILNSSKSGAGVATSASAQPPVEEPKKPVLGEIHLAKPKVSPGRRTQTVGEPDAGINLTSDDQPDAESLNTGLAVSNNQPSAPAAPLPVGGDVKQAKLISSVPPVYPMLAKNQHVSGNVMVDALIDANGRVTTMKIVSGPTQLQQAAMDALKQWKYQPATLDGKPVAMHLTVTVQFRLQ